jgi:hypothetical protein
MFKLVVPAREMYDDSKNLFYMTEEYVLQLEHSLISISKWESKWCKPFLSKGEKTHEESVDYIRCMTITQGVSEKAYEAITTREIDLVTKYIDAPMTATVINEEKRVQNREIVTSEILYYWMVALAIPFECQKWHLNRLLTLISVYNIKSKPPKRMSGREILSRNARLNAVRRAQNNSKG